MTISKMYGTAVYFFIFSRECDLSVLVCFVLGTTSVSPLDRDKGGGP